MEESEETSSIDQSSSLKYGNKPVKLFGYSDSDRFLGINDKYKLELVSEKSLICTEIKQHF